VAALALTALALGGAGALGAPQAASAAPACAAGWDVYEGSWHLSGGFPARLRVSCDNGYADWIWQTPYSTGFQHLQQAAFYGVPYLEGWSPSGSNFVIMQYGDDPNHIVFSTRDTTGELSTWDLYRG
jgi:hypothetical protein